MNYRAEVDGLRAVAILPVVFFHAGFKAFEGGFVGVDVFFVISGYLITTIIVTDMNTDKFSILTFYERRARRIMPALFFVMLCSLPFAWLVLLPNHLKDFSQSLTAVSAFSSNILFWRESGYFGVALELKPLLHTWSLAVEEQYYVLFPLFLMLLWELRKRWIFGAMIVVAAMSLAVAQWGAYNNPSATFFLLPTRAWELAIGALIAFYFLYKREHAELIKRYTKTSEVLGAVGLLMICFSVFTFDNTTPFPSLYALIPTIGTGLVIIFATTETAAGKLLSTKFMVGVGLISYSTYLWHQPLFVFARHRSIDEPSTLLLLLLSAASLLLAYISWRYVESPFRNKQLVSRRAIFMFTFVGSVAFAGIGLAGYIKDGKLNKTLSQNIPNIKYSSLSERLSEESVCDWSLNIANTESFTGCIFGDEKSNENIVLVGDSHSEAISYELEQYAKKYNKKVYWLKLVGSEYIPNVVSNRKSPNIKVKQYHKEMLSFIKHLNADVILIYRWTFRMYPIDGLNIQMPYRNSEVGVEKERYREYFVYDNGKYKTDVDSKKSSLINYVQSIANVASSLYLVYPVPETAIDVYRQNLIHKITTGDYLKNLSISVADYDLRNDFVISVFDGLKEKKIIPVRPRELFCNVYASKRCVVQHDFVPYYLDDDHLGDIGAKLILDEIFSNYN